jgi:hydroxylaminobenzene mutase
MRPSADRSVRQAHRLLQLGILLFLVALIVGLFVPAFAVPRLGLSTHLLGLMQGLFLVAAGLLWPRLRLTRAIGQAAFVLVVYGCLAAWTANFVGAVVGAGNSMLPIAAGQARGSDLQETLIAVLLRSGGLSLIASTALIFWGLRGAPSDVPPIV